MNILPSAFRAMESELGFSPVILAGFQTIQGARGCMSGQFWVVLPQPAFEIAIRCVKTP